MSKKIGYNSVYTKKNCGLKQRCPLPVEKRLKSFNEVATGLAEEDAICEAARCRK